MIKDAVDLLRSMPLSVLIGACGSGKTRLLHALAMIRADAGSVRKKADRERVREFMRQAFAVSGASGGQEQMLFLLLEILSRGDGDAVLLDNPGTDLDPVALSVLARAFKDVASKGCRVCVTTHSPVLMSQFESDQVLVVRGGEGRITLTPVCELEEIRDLASEYSIGSLYMAGMLTGQ